MDEYDSLSHSKWECKYHVVFIPKYRRKKLYKELRQHLGEVFRRLAEQKVALFEAFYNYWVVPKHTIGTQLLTVRMALDTKTNQILTITAEYGPVPVAPVAPAKVASVTTSTGGPPPATPPSGIPTWMLGPRPPMIPGSFQILVIGK